MKRPAAILVLGTAVACAHTNAPVTDAMPKLGPICPHGVKVFWDAAKVGRPFQEVALLFIRLESEAGYTSQNRVTNYDLKSAADLGANGLIVGELPTSTTRTRALEALNGPGPERRAVLAIYIPGDTSRVRAACDGRDNR
jgi:hypothetical protein